ncbi:sugar kinase [Devosia sp.]|uniref:sugar kinase n=1 Tax=Devosia sp. TaxID=1871048 RepID=UPI0035AE97CF
MSKRFVSVGEAMIEMSGGDEGLYRLGYAGDTLNTAWYARAMLPEDWQVDYVTALGDDMYSAEMRAFIGKAGIGTDRIQTIPGRRPGLYLIHQAHGDRHFTYWRGQSAAKLLADDAEALGAGLAGADTVYFSGISMAILSPRARGRLMKAIVAAREAGAQVVFDTNLRPALWTSPKVMASTLTAAATIADIVLPTHPDEAPLFGDASPDATAERYLAIGASEVVVKNGAEPALVATRDGLRAYVPATRAAKVVDATGAGDSFNGGYLGARARGADPVEAARDAHRVAGVVIGHKGALVDMALVRRG